MKVRKTNQLLSRKEIEYLKNPAVHAIMSKLDPLLWPSIYVTFVKSEYLLDARYGYSRRRLEKIQERVELFEVLNFYFQEATLEIFLLVEQYYHYDYYNYTWLHPLDFPRILTVPPNVTIVTLFTGDNRKEYDLQSNVIEMFLYLYHECRLTHIPAALATFFLYPFLPTVYFSKPIF